MRKKTLIEEKVRIIREARDCRKDYFISKEEAKRLYKEGKLTWDITNETYTEEFPK